MTAHHPCKILNLNGSTFSAARFSMHPSREKRRRESGDVRLLMQRRPTWVALHDAVAVFHAVSMG